MEDEVNDVSLADRGSYKYNDYQESEDRLVQKVNDSILFIRNSEDNFFKKMFLAADELNLLITENQVMRIVFYIIIWFYILLEQSGFILSLIQFQKDGMYNQIETKLMAYLEQPIVIIMLLFYKMVYSASDQGYFLSSFLQNLYKSRRIIGIIFIIVYIAQLSLSIYSLISVFPEWIDNGFVLSFSTIVYLIVQISILSKIFYYIMFLLFEVTFRSEY